MARAYFYEPSSGGHGYGKDSGRTRPPSLRSATGSCGRRSAGAADDREGRAGLEQGRAGPPTNASSLTFRSCRRVHTRRGPGNRLASAGRRHPGVFVASARRSTRRAHSVWVTVTYNPAGLPDAGRPRLAVRRARPRGGRAASTFRVIFWRHNAETCLGRAFDLRRLAGPARDAGGRAAPASGRAGTAPRTPFCQHQKGLAHRCRRDGPRPRSVRWGSISTPRRGHGAGTHAGRNQVHDLFVELAGPSAADVHHNFVQRWNEAS